MVRRGGFKFFCWFLVVSFLITTSVPYSYAQSLSLPAPTDFVEISSYYSFPVLKGIKIDPKNPFEFDFIIDTADKETVSEEEASRLIKYFLAAITIPETDIWVNLSPYEQDIVVEKNLGQTDLGADLLAQDYILKQLTASITYPESPTGRNFWRQTYKEVMKVANTTNLPINTFNKIWIVPKDAQVYENGNTAYVTSAKLKAMLEEDYLALDNNVKAIQHETKGVNKATIEKVNAAASKIMREEILPQINEDINSGENFATLRQIYHSLILGMWFKRKFKESLYSHYINNAKIDGINGDVEQTKEQIYQRYVKAFKDGLYDYIRKDYEPGTRKQIKRRYYSGGFSLIPNASLYQQNQINVSTTDMLSSSAVSVVPEMAVDFFKINRDINASPTTNFLGNSMVASIRVIPKSISPSSQFSSSQQIRNDLPMASSSIELVNRDWMEKAMVNQPVAPEGNGVGSGMIQTDNQGTIFEVSNPTALSRVLDQKLKINVAPAMILSFKGKNVEDFTNFVKAAQIVTPAMNNFQNQVNNLATNVMLKNAEDVSALEYRRRMANNFLRSIRKNIADGKSNPYDVDLALTDNDKGKVEPVDRTLKVGVYPLAGNPIHLDHQLAALSAMATADLDVVVFDVQSGKDIRKVLLQFTEKFRYELAQSQLDKFSPLFRFSENVSPDGETDIFRVLELNPDQKIDAYYIVGGDHFNRWSNAPDNLERGTQEYNQWVEKHGKDPTPDTIQKLEDNIAKYNQQHNNPNHSVSAIFIMRDGDKKTPKNKLKSVIKLGEVGKGSATQIRKALLGRGNVENFSILPYDGYEYIYDQSNATYRSLLIADAVRAELEDKIEKEKEFYEGTDTEKQFDNLVTDLRKWMGGVYRLVAAHDRIQPHEILTEAFDRDVSLNGLLKAVEETVDNDIEEIKSASSAVSLNQRQKKGVREFFAAFAKELLTKNGKKPVYFLSDNGDKKITATEFLKNEFGLDFSKNELLARNFTKDDFENIVAERLDGLRTSASPIRKQRLVSNLEAVMPETVDIDLQRDIVRVPVTTQSVFQKTFEDFGLSVSDDILAQAVEGGVKFSSLVDRAVDGLNDGKIPFTRSHKRFLNSVLNETAAVVNYSETPTAPLEILYPQVLEQKLSQIGVELMPQQKEDLYNKKMSRRQFFETVEQNFNMIQNINSAVSQEQNSFFRTRVLDIVKNYGLSWNDSNTLWVDMTSDAAVKISNELAKLRFDITAKDLTDYFKTGQKSVDNFIGFLNTKTLKSSSAIGDAVDKVLMVKMDFIDASGRPYVGLESDSVPVITDALNRVGLSVSEYDLQQLFRNARIRSLVTIREELIKKSISNLNSSIQTAENENSTLTDTNIKSLPKLKEKLYFLKQHVLSTSSPLTKNVEDVIRNNLEVRDLDGNLFVQVNDTRALSNMTSQLNSLGLALENGDVDSAFSGSRRITFETLKSQLFEKSVANLRAYMAQELKRDDVSDAVKARNFIELGNRLKKHPELSVAKASSAITFGSEQLSDMKLAVDTIKEKLSSAFNEFVSFRDYTNIESFANSKAKVAVFNDRQGGLTHIKVPLGLVQLDSNNGKITVYSDSYLNQQKLLSFMLKAVDTAREEIGVGQTDSLFSYADNQAILQNFGQKYTTVSELLKNEPDIANINTVEQSLQAMARARNSEREVFDFVNRFSFQVTPGANISPQLIFKNQDTNGINIKDGFKEFGAKVTDQELSAIKTYEQFESLVRVKMANANRASSALSAPELNVREKISNFGGIDLENIDIYTDPASVPIEFAPFDVESFTGFDFNILSLEPVDSFELDRELASANAK